MISRRTVFSLLLAVLIALGLKAWLLQRVDPCDRYVQGDRTVPASEYVEIGTRTIEVPCGDWIMRMPEGVQVTCLVDLAVWVVFVLGLVQDVVRRRSLVRRRIPAG